MNIPKAPSWSDLLTPEGKIKWESVPSTLLNLLDLLDPTQGLMMPIGKIGSWKPLDVKKTLGSDLIKEIIERGYTPEVRSKILEKLAFSPQRRKIISEVKPLLEEIYSSSPGVSKGRAYLIGSFGTTKMKPSDFDMLIRPRGEPYVSNIISEVLSKHPSALDVFHPMVVGRLAIPKGLSAAKKKAGPSWAQAMISGSRKRYGSSYTPIRLWGASPPPFTSILDFLSEE